MRIGHTCRQGRVLKSDYIIAFVIFPQKIVFLLLLIARHYKFMLCNFTVLVLAQLYFKLGWNFRGNSLSM